MPDSVKPAVPCCSVLTELEPITRAPVFCMTKEAAGSMLSKLVAALNTAPWSVTPPVPTLLPFQPM